MAHPAHKWMRKRKRGGGVEGGPPPQRLDRPGKIGLMRTGSSDPGTVASGNRQKNMETEDNPPSDRENWKRGGGVKRAEGGPTPSDMDAWKGAGGWLPKGETQQQKDVANPPKPEQKKHGGSVTSFRTPSGGVSAHARRAAEGKGESMPGGRFPIRNASDLSNAKHDYGRANDKPAVKRWINKRAKELGEPAMGES